MAHHPIELSIAEALHTSIFLNLALILSFLPRLDTLLKDPLTASFINTVLRTRVFPDHENGRKQCDHQDVIRYYEYSGEIPE